MGPPGWGTWRSLKWDSLAYLDGLARFIPFGCYFLGQLTCFSWRTLGQYRLPVQLKWRVLSLNLVTSPQLRFLQHNWEATQLASDLMYEMGPKAVLVWAQGCI